MIHETNFKGLPGCLSDLMTEHRWCGWRWEERTDKHGEIKRTKPPRQASGALARNDDPSTWASFDMIAKSSQRFDGPGLQLLSLTGFGALDLDNVRDPETGALLPWAEEAARWHSYCEITPSGTGLRVLGRVSPTHLPMHGKKSHPGGGEIEFYVNTNTGRYITVSGQRLPDAPDDLRPIDDLIAKIRADIEAGDQDANRRKKEAGGKSGFAFDDDRQIRDFDDLPHELRTRIAHGWTGDKSADFQAAVNGLFVRVSFETALRFFEMHPDGPAGKYAGRLEQELRRSWEKAAATSTSQGRKGGEQSAKATTDEWTEPDARFLRTVLPEPPVLPLDDVFSPSWARWIRTAAEAKGAPADYVVAALLSTAGALIGNTRWATPWDGWSEVPIIWAMAIGNPSAGKSPGLDAVLTPLKRIEREERQAADVEHAEWAKKAEVARLVASTWKEEVKAALKSGDTPPEKPKEADAGSEPIKPRYALADATVEKLAVIVAAQPRGTLMARDELSGWLGNMSRYSGGSDRPFWLEAYGGRGYNVERMGRESIWIDHLSVGVLGGIQPDKLKSLLIKTDDDGLLARFLPVFPNPAPIKQPEVGIDDAFIEAALRRLLTLTMVPTEAGEMRPWYVPFNDGARELLNAFRQEARGWEAGQEGLILSFIGKLPGLAVRLSLILGLLDWAEGGPDLHEISEEHFERAASLIEAYVLAMARRAYAGGSVPKELSAGAKLAAIIIEHRWQRFTTSDVLRLNRAGLNTKAELDPALDALETGDLIRAVIPKPEGRGRGRPSRTFLVNPAIGAAG